MTSWFYSQHQELKTSTGLYNQGRIQDFVLGGTKVGEGSGDRLPFRQHISVSTLHNKYIYNTLHHIHKMLQNCWRKSFLNTKNPGAFGGALPPVVPYQGSALNPLETLGGPQTPRRLSSPLTQNPGSAPDYIVLY
jgi:hypothetical protein